MRLTDKLKEVSATGIHFALASRDSDSDSAHYFPAAGLHIISEAGKERGGSRTAGSIFGIFFSASSFSSVSLLTSRTWLWLQMVPGRRTRLFAASNRYRSE